MFDDREEYALGTPDRAPQEFDQGSRVGILESLFAKAANFQAMPQFEFLLPTQQKYDLRPLCANSGHEDPAEEG